MFSEQQLKKLDGLLSPDRISQRDGMSYIMAWDASYTANEIFGFDGWDRETVEMRMVQDIEDQKGQRRVGYIAKVRITVRAGDTVIVREGTGGGQGINRDLFKAHEGATKEAESDAMKRALTQFGNQFGLALYDKQQRGVGYEQDNHSDELQALTDDLAGVAPEGVSVWMTDNLSAIKDLAEDEQAVIKRMCAAKLHKLKQAS
jgi:DNA recombination protein Rad52